MSDPIYPKRLILTRWNADVAGDPMTDIDDAKEALKNKTGHERFAVLCPVCLVTGRGRKSALVVNADPLWPVCEEHGAVGML